MSLRAAAVLLAFIGLLAATRVSAPSAETQRLKPLRWIQPPANSVKDLRHYRRTTGTPMVDG